MGRVLLVGSSLDPFAAFERIVGIHYLKKLHLVVLLLLNINNAHKHGT